MEVQLGFHMLVELKTKCKDVFIPYHVLGEMLRAFLPPALAEEVIFSVASVCVSVRLSVRLFALCRLNC